MENGTMVRNKELEMYQRALGTAMEALQMYADPESYHAVAFMVDRPAGSFADDFGSKREHGHPYYERHMPGKLARKTLKRLTSKYGDLVVINRG